MRREVAAGFVLLFLALAAALPGAVHATEVTFKPVEAPARGPENAPVTMYIIADFM